MAASSMQGPTFTALDRLIGWLNPRAGLSRHFDRLRLQRAYEAASPRDPWKPRRSGASANTDHQADAAAIRAKARSIVQNVPYIRAGIEALVAATVGTGIVTYSKSVKSAEVLDKLFAEWSKVCDADGRLDWFGMQAAADRAMEQDGEVLIRLRPRLATDGYPVPLQLQLLEIDWLDTSRMTGAMGNNSIVNGIEYDLFGEVAAYWLWEQHPGEVAGGWRTGNRTQSKRIPASSIIHLFAPERPGAGRGISRLASVITRVRDLQLYEDAELARKNLEARLSVLVSGDASAMANPSTYGTAADQANAAATGDLGQLPSGGIMSLPPGLNVTTVAPQASVGYVDYVKFALHLIAVGMGVTYEMLTGDMRDVNFSSARIRMIDFRRQVEAMQWLCLVPRLCAPVWKAFVDAAVLAGKIPRADYACDHSMPKWDYVNPEQDAKSEQSLISSGLLTISESLRRRGYQPDTVFAEIKSDFDKLRELGVLDVLMAMQGKGAANQAADANAAAQSSARAEDLMHQVLDRVSQPTPERNIVVNNNVAPAAVEVTNDVNPTPVTVENRVEAPAVTVTNEVNPTPVTVQNNVAQAAVTVENRVESSAVTVQNHFDPNISITTPPRRTDSIVERDTQGRVLRSISIERDAPEANQ